MFISLNIGHGQFQLQHVNVKSKYDGSEALDYQKTLLLSPLVFVVSRPTPRQDRSFDPFLFSKRSPREKAGATSNH